MNAVHLEIFIDKKVDECLEDEIILVKIMQICTLGERDSSPVRMQSNEQEGREKEEVTWENNALSHGKQKYMADDTLPPLPAPAQSKESFSPAPKPQVEGAQKKKAKV